MATTTATQVQQLYVGLLGRAADSAGLAYWTNQITTGARTLDDVRAAFVTTTEYTTGFGALTARADLVTAIYTNLFERTPTAAEVAYWVADTRPANQLVSAFLTYASAADQTVIGNKTFVAQTYTDTVSAANFTIAGATASIANVDGTTTSVNTALTAINSGALAGQVPGLNLINAKVAAEAAVVAYGTTNKAALDALATKLNVATTGTFSVELGLAVTAANTARTTASAEADTGVLVARAATATTALNTAFNALTAAEKTAANAYSAAIAKEASTKAAIATVTEAAGVKAALNADTTATAKVTAHTDIATLYSDYVNGTTAARTAIDTEFAGIATYTAFKAAAVKDAAYADAIKATLAAKDVLDTDGTASTVTAAGFNTASGTINGVTVTAPTTDASVGSAAANTYVTSLATKTTADTTVTAAQAADANIAAVKVFNDALTALNTTSTAATTAIGTFNTTNTGVSVINDLDVTSTATAAKDVFYFADKATSVAVGDDYTIGSFTTGDAIVLGSGYTLNTGALSTANNNALEVFFVNSNSGVQIVVESTVAGTTNVAANATTGVITTNAGATDTATVITLTGVTADHLSYTNGVISYV